MNSTAKQSTQHTPVPWKVKNSYHTEIFGSDGSEVISLGDDGGCSDPECCGGETYHVEISAPNAALIVKAVNCHDELVAACKTALDAILFTACPAGMPLSRYEYVTQMLRAALKQAESS